MRVEAAEQKYAEAVAMYADTDLTIRCVAKKCGVTATGLSAHIGKHHRALLFARYGLDINDKNLHTLKVKPPKGQSIITHLKYKDAIEACGNVAYIEFNVSQVARMFNLDGSALAAQLRVHYPDIIPNRENLRQYMGIADNTHRCPRPWCIEAYAEAVEMYRDTDLTIPEVAERCNVSKSGLYQFLRFYHKDVITAKSVRRKAARRNVGVREPGKLAGNGNLYGPKPETVEMYAPALELFRNTSMTIDEIVEVTGIPATGFKGYLHQWHRGEQINPMSAVFVIAKAEGEALKELTVNLTEDMICSPDNQVDDSSESTSLKVRASSGKSSSSMAVLTESDITNTALFDNEVAPKLAIFTTIDGEACDIVPAADIVPLTIIADKNANIRLDIITNGVNRDEWILVDNVTKIEYPLDREIMLPDGIGTSSGRFCLVRGIGEGNTSGVESIKDFCRNVYVTIHDNKITATATEGNISSMEVYALSGVKVDGIVSSQPSLSLKVARGIYVVRVMASNKLSTHKIMVR